MISLHLFVDCVYILHTVVFLDDAETVPQWENEELREPGHGVDCPPSHSSLRFLLQCHHRTAYLRFPVCHELFFISQGFRRYLRLLIFFFLKNLIKREIQMHRNGFLGIPLDSVLETVLKPTLHVLSLSVLGELGTRTCGPGRPLPSGQSVQGGVGGGKGSVFLSCSRFLLAAWKSHGSGSLCSFSRDPGACRARPGRHSAERCGADKQDLRLFGGLCLIHHADWNDAWGGAAGRCRCWGGTATRPRLSSSAFTPGSPED